MKELQKLKTFIKYQVLLLQQALDIEKARDDARKTGLAFLGIILEKTYVISGLFLIVLGIYLWYLGVTKRD